MKYLPHNYYHVYNRGNEGKKIFREAENYRFFLDRLHHYYVPSEVSLLAYCLMPNHYHLLVRLEKEFDFSNVMRGFTTSYVRSFNSWHGRVGYLFQGNTQPKLIDQEGYLTHLCRYIHLNPVAAGLVSSPERWKYSDYASWISDHSTSTHPSIALRNELFGTGEEYRRFVMDLDEARRKEQEIVQLLYQKRKQKSQTEVEVRTR